MGRVVYRPPIYHNGTTNTLKSPLTTELSTLRSIFRIRGQNSIRKTLQLKKKHFVVENGEHPIGVSCHEGKTCTRSDIVRYFQYLRYCTRYFSCLLYPTYKPVNQVMIYDYRWYQLRFPRNIYPLSKRFSKPTFIKWMKQKWILRQREPKSQLGWFQDFKIFPKEYCKSCAPIRDENKRVFVFVRVRRVQYFQQNSFSRSFVFDFFENPCSCSTFFQKRCVRIRYFHQKYAFVFYSRSCSCSIQIYEIGSCY